VDNATNGRGNSRAVIIGGVRTPFLRAFGDFMLMDTIALGAANVQKLLEKFPIDKKEINGVVWGGVILPGQSANIGREITLDSGLPREVEATTVTRACTSGMKAIAMAVEAIERGDADVMIAGGSDSTSNAEVKMPQSFVHKTAPVTMSSKSGPMDYLKLAARMKIRKDLMPQRPSVRERSTKELMGESAEKMAGRNGITREAQDALALQSHQRAAESIRNGRLAQEVCSVVNTKGKVVSADNLVRADTSLEKLAKLKPAFKKGGTLTAGNSSPLTDGSAAVLLMSREKAKALGLAPLAEFRSWSFDAVDPWDQMLMGPAFSIPRALKKAGMTLKDIGVIDIHEAFAAQVLSILKMLGNDKFAQERLGLSKAVGEILPEQINIHGGSIALGHPFGATGARMVITMANELKLSGKESAVMAICGAGGVSVGAIIVAAS